MIPEKCFCRSALRRVPGVDWRPAMAERVPPGEFLGLDLSKAVLSPKRLGPDTEFAMVPIEAKADRGDVVHATPDAVAAPKPAVRNQPVASRRDRAAAGARIRPARRHGNPLDAQASAAPRIQTWPCKSGGICGWQR